MLTCWRPPSAKSAVRRTRQLLLGAGGNPCRLDETQIAQLRAALEAGPAAYGWKQDQRWTLARVAALIERLSGVSYTLRGVSFLLHRLGFSPQVPAHRAFERAWRDHPFIYVPPVVTSLSGERVLVTEWVDGVGFEEVRELDGATLRQIAWGLEKTGTDLCVAPALLDVAGPRTTIRPIAGLTLLHVDHPQLSGPRQVLKDLFDLTAAAAALSA